MPGVLAAPKNGHRKESRLAALVGAVEAGRRDRFQLQGVQARPPFLLVSGYAGERGLPAAKSTR